VHDGLAARLVLHLLDQPLGGHERLLQHLLALLEAARALLQLAESQRAVLEKAQDQPGPGARKQVHRVLEGATVGIDPLAHPACIVPHVTFQREAT